MSHPGGLLVLGAILAIGGAAGCGGTTGDGTRRTGDGAGSGGAPGASVPGAGGSQGGVDVPGAGGFATDCQACAGTATNVELPPVGMYFLLDRSAAMGEPVVDGGGSWWEALQAGLPRVLTNISAADIGVQYFPNFGDACSTASYSTPETGLTGFGDAKASIASIQTEHPDAASGRPTVPALEGAIERMKSWAAERNGAVAGVVLVTAGIPSQCDPRDVAALTAIATAAFETEPRVRTFVIRAGAGATDDLDDVGKAGGGSKTRIVQPSDAENSFVDAFREVSSRPDACALELPRPPAGDLDPALIDVRYTVSDVTRHLSKIQDASECASAGNTAWFFDSATTPTKAMLCPTFCAGAAGLAFEVVLGCHPVGCIPH